MRTLTAVLTLLIIVTMFNCSKTDPVEELIREHLAETSGSTASKVKILTFSELQAWLASDSLEILQIEFIRQKTDMMGHLEASLETSKIAIEEGKKVKDIGYTYLSNMADETIREAELQIEMVLATIEGLNQDCQGTPLEDLYNTIESYESRGDELLHYVLEGEWKSKGEDKTQHFSLTADKDLSAIL